MEIINIATIAVVGSVLLIASGFALLFAAYVINDIWEHHYYSNGGEKWD